MKISENWLREWVNPAISTEELVRCLTMAGLEVDGTEKAANDFTGVVVGEVLSVSKHPDADKLNICAVSDGEQTYQVVCGAPNVRPGLRIPFAKVGAQLAPDFKIKKAKLRGVESHGMLCSAQELGLSEAADGLLELPIQAPVGQDLRAYLNLDDNLIEVDLTPNRGDCLSIAGIAREVAVLTRSVLTRSSADPVAATHTDSLPVTLASSQGCPRYLGRVIRNINIEAETPLWMQEKLRRCGLRSIDPVVDVTNFVLIELGQPMHAFDLSAIDQEIVVRQALDGEKLVLLDGKEVALDQDVLVIADASKALAMAGVMGGKQSSVGVKTSAIFLESAYFNPVMIAGKARKYGFHTDAAHRYERGVDYELPAAAMERATSLLLQIVGGEAGPVVEASAELPVVAPVVLRKARIQSLLGLELPEQEVLRILTDLGFVVSQSDTASWTFTVPSWRFDVALEADLIEEIARVHGYDNLPVKSPLTRLKLQHKPEGQLALGTVKRTLVSLGYQEVVTYSFVEQDLDSVLGDGGNDAIALANPISQDMGVMRSTIWSGLISTLKHNQNRQQTRCRLFESGLTFYKKNNKIEQRVKVSSLIWGQVDPEQWASPARSADFFDLKGDVETLLQLSHDQASFSFTADRHQALQPGQTARIYRGEQPIGWMGALHPKLMQALDITGKVFLLELDFAALRDAVLPAVVELSRFPSVRRDLAFTVAKQIEVAQIRLTLQEAAGEALSELNIFDLYQGQNIEKDKKSLALGLTFQHASRTLTDLEINPIIDKCIKALQAKFNAELR